MKKSLIGKISLPKIISKSYNGEYRKSLPSYI